MTIVEQIFLGILALWILYVIFVILTLGILYVILDPWLVHKNTSQVWRKNEKNGGVDMSRKHYGDYKARRALKAVSTVIEYLNDEKSLVSNTEWVDTKGYAMDCDCRYFFEGLVNFRHLLVERLNKAVPRYSPSINIGQRELFTCRNCVHRDKDNHWCKVWKHGISEEDWCSYGEGKEE